VSDEDPRSAQEQINKLQDDNPHLDRRDEPSIAWVLKVIVMAMLVAAAIPTSLFLYLDNKSSDQRIRQNRNLIEQVADERIAAQEAINDFIFDQCIQAEVRDRVYAQWGGDLLLILNAIPESKSDSRVQKLIADLEDGIADLEPPGEKDCVPPPASTP
jgi:hypothetical protein